MRDTYILLIYGLIVLITIAIVLYKPWRLRRCEPPQASPKVTYAIDTTRHDLHCLASWYAYPEHGRPTASGEIFDSASLTCAIYRPFLDYAGGWGARLLVKNMLNGRYVIVRINDAMPSRYARGGRMLDLSKAAAESLDMVRIGVVPVLAWKLDGK